ncbi:MAG: hypothetical protein IJY10_07625 [Lachnospiraceae bacterium]|nr:hypothetical protein [Lachnospiraceae bacterium]
MNQDDKWLRFANSGKIEDYLEYNKSRQRQENLVKQIEVAKGLDYFAGLGLTDEGANLHAGDDYSDWDGVKPDAYR